MADTSPQIAKCQYGSFTVQDIQMSYDVGYTQVTIHNYMALKLTAEQNSSTNQLLVIAFPEKSGLLFTIQSVQAGQGQQNGLEGPVATVKGTLSVQTNEPAPLQIPLTVPVQISAVSQYTISPQEALMQGLQFFTVGQG